MLRKDQTTIGIDEGEESKVSGIDQSFTKIMMIKKKLQTKERHTHADTRNVQDTK